MIEPVHTKFRLKKQTFSAQMLPRHLRATKALGYVLTADSADAWAGLAAILSVRLDPRERAALTFAAAARLDVGHMEMVFEHIRATHLRKWASADVLSVKSVLSEGVGA